MYKYKILTMKDKEFSYTFSYAILEKVLNDYASKGWKVISINGLTYLKESDIRDFYILLEREDIGV